MKSAHRDRDRSRGRDRVLKSEWMLAVEYVETARVQLSALDFTTSLDLCDRALRVSPNYYPAMELRKKICEAQRLIGVTGFSPSGTVYPSLNINTKFNSKSEGDLRGVGVGGELLPTPRFTSTPNRKFLARFSKVSPRRKLNRDRDRDQRRQVPEFKSHDYYYGGEIKGNKHVHWAKEPGQRINKITKTAPARPEPGRSQYLPPPPPPPQKQNRVFQHFQDVLYCIYYFIFYLVKNSFELANTVFYEMINFLHFLIDLRSGNYQNRNIYTTPGTGRREWTREIGINSIYPSGKSTEICRACKALLREQFLVPIRIEIIGCPHCHRYGSRL